MIIVMNTQTIELTKMNTQVIPNFILIEADNLSKETRIPFRDCLEVIYKLYLKEIAREPREKEKIE